MADILENLVSPFPHLLNSSITAGFIVLVILAVRLVFRRAPLI